MTWTIFVTAWIVLQAIIGAAMIPRLFRLQGKSEYQVMGGITGKILWGLSMIGALYMAGLYAQ